MNPQPFSFEFDTLPVDHLHFQNKSNKLISKSVSQSVGMPFNESSEMDLGLGRTPVRRTGFSTSSEHCVNDGW